MKNKKKINEQDFFRVGCKIDGGEKEIYLEIPNRLYGDFERCLKSSAGMSTLSSIFDELSKLNDVQRLAYQMSVFDFADKIKDVADMGCMLRAFKKVFVME